MTQRSYKLLRIARAAAIAAALLFIALGIHRNEVFEVFKKASRICLECIGVG